MNSNTDTGVEIQGFDNALMRRLGNGRVLEWDEKRQRIAVGFEASEAFCDTDGAVHGGFITAWIDNAMAVAVRYACDSAYLPATLEVNVSYFRPTLPGFVRAEAWIVRMGRSVAFVEGRLLDVIGETLASASSTIKLVPRRD